VISRIPLYSQAVAVVPSDTGTLEFKGLYIGGTGDVVINDTAGNKTTLKALPVGTFVPIAGERVWSTNTTATNIVALT
jgi:DNA-binding beta-propeller fold protein YncE